MPEFITGREFGVAVCHALGLDPSRVARVVIDAPADGVVKVYVEEHGTRALLDVLPARGTVEVQFMPADGPLIPEGKTGNPEQVTAPAPAPGVGLERREGEDEPPNPRPDDLTCGWCGEVFPSKQRRASHEGRHITRRCDICGQEVARTGLGPHRKACDEKRRASLRERSPGAPDDDTVQRRRERAAAAAYGDGF